MKFNLHSIGGALAATIGWLVTSGVINVHALPPHYAMAFAILATVYAAQSDKAVRVRSDPS